MISLFVIVCLLISAALGVPNFKCLMCICETLTNCTSKPCDSWKHESAHMKRLDRGCGPFAITPEIWIEANKPVLKKTHEVEMEKFKKCAETMLCSIWTVEYYLGLHSRDCDGDGKINCDDFLLVYNFGHSSCVKSTLDNEKLNRYNTCMNRKELIVLKRKTPSKISGTKQNSIFAGKYHWTKREAEDEINIIHQLNITSEWNYI